MIDYDVEPDLALSNPVHRRLPSPAKRPQLPALIGQFQRSRQYLHTTPNIGYAVIDIDGVDEEARELRERLDGVPGTIRTRMLS